MSDVVVIPPGLTPMLTKAYVACQDWCDAETLAECVGGKTPAKVIVSMLRAKLERFGMSVETDTFCKQKPKRYRISHMKLARAS